MPAGAARNAGTVSPVNGRAPQIWASIPEVSPSGRALTDHRVVAGNASQVSTPFDILRTKILLQMQQNGWTRLAITSPMPQSGKTTTACNLALGLGRQSGLRTILFDFDLQDPSVGEFLGIQPKHSISELLSEEVPFGQQAVRVGENVAVSLSSKVEKDPTRILLASKTHKVLDSVQSTYAPDVMIFDVPSTLVGDNTRAFLKNVDCALIVTRANDTRYGHFDACEREVAEYTNVLGVVLNAFRSSDPTNHMDI